VKDLFNQFKENCTKLWPKAKIGVSPQEANKLGRKTMAKVCCLRNIVLLRSYFNKLKRNARKEIQMDLTKKLMKGLINKNEILTKKNNLRNYFLRFLKTSQNLLTKEMRQSFSIKLSSNFIKKYSRNLIIIFFKKWALMIKQLNKIEQGLAKVI
jgi:hypothetical protein